MRKIKLLIVLLFTISFYSQEKSSTTIIDSLLVVLSKTTKDTAKINLINKIAIQYKIINSEKGILYANKAIKLSKYINWKDGLANSYMSLGINNINLARLDSAQNNFNEALKHAESKNIKAQVQIELASVFTSKSDYVKAFEYCTKALTISSNTKNELGIANAYSGFGKIYYYTNETQKAIAYFNKALIINTKLNNKVAICKNLEGIGLSYYDIFEPDKAIFYFNKSMVIAKQTDNKESLTFLYYSLGKVALDQNKVKEALNYFIKAKNTAKSINYNRLLNTSIVSEADAYVQIFSKNQSASNYYLLEKAESLLLQSIEISKKNNVLTNQSFALKRLSHVYSLKNDHKKAKDIYVLYADLQDSIYNEDSKESIQNLEDKNTIDQKNAEIKINKITLKAKEKQKYYLFAGLGLVSIIGFLLFYQSKNRKKINEKLQVLNNDLDQANKVKARFFGILNHDLRSPVNNLIHYLHLQKESPELLDEATKTQIESETMTSAENLLSSMEDMLLWSKGQMENFKPQPKNVTVDQLFNDTKKVFSGYLHVNFEYHNPNNLEIFTDENYLKTIIRNLTSNAINVFKTIDNPKIIWKAWQEKNVIYLTITDNGKGAENEQFKALYDDSEVIGIQSGLGLHLIRDLAKAIDCEISVDSKIGFGTTFVLKMK